MTEKITSSSKKHILVIDDEVSILNIVRTALASHYEITTYNEPQKAWADLEYNLIARPHAIICDVMMPEMDGFEFHARLRQAPNLMSIPFIYLTALDDREYFRRGMVAGADDYITKPFTPEDLRRSLKVRLERVKDLQNYNEPDDVMVIESLGGFRVTLGHNRINWSVKKAAVAFLYLLENPTAISLDKVKRDLWREDVADNTLHVLNLRLRKVINDFSELVVENRKAQLHIDYPITWDMRDFRRMAQEGLNKRDQALVEQAIAMYKGEFMPSFDVPWAERQRNHLETIFMQLLELSIDLAPEATRGIAQERLERYLDV